MKMDYEIADSFRKEVVAHGDQRKALAERLGNCRGSDGHGGFSWVDRWLAVKEIEDLLSALIDQKFGRNIDIAPRSIEPVSKIKDGT